MVNVRMPRLRSSKETVPISDVKPKKRKKRTAVVQLNFDSEPESDSDAASNATSSDLGPISTKKRSLVSAKEPPSRIKRNQSRIDSEQNAKSEATSDLTSVSKSTSEPEAVPNAFSDFFKFQKDADRLKTLGEKYDEKNSKKLEVAENEDIKSMLRTYEKGAAGDESTSKYFQRSSESEECSENDWEEVGTNETMNTELKDIEVVIDLPNTIKKKKGVDLMASLKRKMNKNRKDAQIQVHQVHMLCYLAFGSRLNSILNGEIVLASAVSLLPSKLSYPPKKISLEYLEKIVVWFSKNFKSEHSDSEIDLDLLQEQVLNEIRKKKFLSNYRTIFVFVALLRALGLQCRLVLSFQCIPLKPEADKLFSLKKNLETTETKSKKSKTKTPAGHKKILRTKPIKSNDKRVISSDESDGEDEAESGSDAEAHTISAPKKDLHRKPSVASSSKIQKGMDYWVEVFLEEEEKWISVNILSSQIHCIEEIIKKASKPIIYVVCWDNHGRIKDITKRYCENWNTLLRRRVDSDWWAEVLGPYTGVRTLYDIAEDEDLHKQQLDQPLPTSISEYKNHTLYVLKRHLLKFEAIYPENAPVFGYVRNEAVYPRECVHTLHSREIWLKQAKTVRLQEKPYKIVKSRPKYDRLSKNYISNLPLELFGYWQVEDYKPPKVVDGVIPRNAYGNVDLFKSCMVPEGGVHIRLNGLNKVAKKCGIDCAPAVVGFDFHSGASHPTFDGFIVAKEFEDLIRSAWVQDRIETEKRLREKRQTRAFGNWRKFIKGMLIKEKLRIKYKIGAK